MLIISTSNCHYELVDTDRILFDRDCCCSVTQSCLTLWDPHGLQHTRLTCPSSISWSLLKLMSIESVMPSTILSPVVPFSSCLQFFPTSGSFLELALCIRWPKYWSFSFSISPSNEYSELISFRITVLISLQSKGLSKVFSSTTIWKHQFFGTQCSLWSNSHIHTWLLEKP